MRAVVHLACVVMASLARPALAAPADATWLSSVSQAIRESEYHLAPAGDAPGWTAANRAQGIRAAWHDGALEIRPRLDDGTGASRTRSRRSRARARRNDSRSRPLRSSARSRDASSGSARASSSGT